VFLLCDETPGKAFAQELRVTTLAVMPT